MNNNYCFESILPRRKKWKMIWNDEFDGDTLDESKWSYRTHMMHCRHTTFAESGVQFDGNSNMIMPLMEKDGHYYAPHLQTGSNFMDNLPESYGNSKFSWPIAKQEKPKFTHKYGYYECRCKLPEQPGWWAAFWLQSPIIGSTLDASFSGVELDIMENFTRDGIISHNNHWNGYGSQHKHAGSGPRKLKETPDGFHVFGVEWSRDGYCYYVDGELSWRIEGPVSDCEQFILISTECMGYRGGDEPAPELKKAVLPDAFIVDYVRVFDEIEPVEKVYWHDEQIACYIYKEKESFQASLWHYGESRGLEIYLDSNMPMGMDKPDEPCIKLSDNASFLTYRESDLEAFVSYIKKAKIYNTIPLLPSEQIRFIPTSSGTVCVCALKNDSPQKHYCKCNIKGLDFNTSSWTDQIDSRSEITVQLPVIKEKVDSGTAEVNLYSDSEHWNFKVECQAMPKICRSDGTEYCIEKSVKPRCASHEAHFNVTRNEDILNFQFRVYDSTPSGKKGNRIAWEQDSIELFFDPNPEQMSFMTPYAYHDNMLRFFILPYLEEDEMVEYLAGYERIFNLNDVVVNREILKDGYFIEFKVPMKKLNFDYSTNNRYLGFDIVVNDADGVASADSALSWNSFGTAHNNRLSMGFIEIT